MRLETAQPDVAFIAVLEVEDPDGTRTKHPFRHPRISVGRRRPDNDLALDDEAVSLRHCEFAEDQGFFVVRDLGSSNGTFVNRERVGEARLQNGDEVRIGSTTIHVVLTGDVRELPPPSRLRPWAVAIGAAALLVAGGILVSRAVAGVRDGRARARLVAAVRESLRTDPCRPAAPLSDLAATEAALAGRSVALSLANGTLRLSAEDERIDRELLALYRRRLDGYAALSAALRNQQQAARDSLEKISRTGDRLSAPGDRRMIRGLEASLNARLSAVDELANAVETLGTETRRLCELVEGALGRRDAGNAEALARFTFTRELRPAADACASAASRASEDALSALRGLDEE